MGDIHALLGLLIYFTDKRADGGMHPLVSRQTVGSIASFICSIPVCHQAIPNK